jgi:hypothetical protein
MCVSSSFVGKISSNVALTCCVAVDSDDGRVGGMYHGILVCDPLLQLSKKYVDVVKYSEEKSATLDEFNSEMYGILGNPNFEPFNSSPRHTHPGIAQHFDDT